ncbi:MAG: hypothetical protein C0598_00080 [Marinilabiliales bacterium]|nr:MAG: hypothetical protein C0598_00080 [Marinilabiliales bacterium]
MPLSTNIRIKGKIAEIIDDEAGRNVRIICNSEHVLVKITDLNDIGLGDDINLKGNIDIKSLEINDIEVNINKY